MNRGPLVAHLGARPWLVSLDPRVKLAWLMAVSLVAVVLRGMPSLAGLMLFVCLPLVGVQMSRLAMATFALLVVLTIWTTMLSQGLFYQGVPRTTVLTLGPLAIYREGLSDGFVQSLRFVASVVAGVIVVASTSPERLLAAMIWLRVPSAIAFVAVTALRTLPTMIDEWLSIRQARRLRAGRSTHSWWRNGFDEAGLLVALLAVSLRRAATLATAVAARGFRPDAPRTFYPPLKLTLAEGLLAIGLGIACAAICGQRAWSVWIG